MNKRKIPMKNFNSDLSLIFKNRLDKLGYSTWKELTDKLGLDNPRSFVDFFNGKQCLSKEVLKNTFSLLDIPQELLEIYAEPISKSEKQMTEICYTIKYLQELLEES